MQLRAYSVIMIYKKTKLNGSKLTDSEYGILIFYRRAVIDQIII